MENYSQRFYKNSSMRKASCWFLIPWREKNNLWHSRCLLFLQVSGHLWNCFLLYNVKLTVLSWIVGSLSSCCMEAWMLLKQIRLMINIIFSNSHLLLFLKMTQEITLTRLDCSSSVLPRWRRQHDPQTKFVYF